MAQPVPTNAPLLFTPRILWGALLVSTFIYLFVLHTLAVEPVSGSELATLRIALSAVALATAVASFVIPFTMHAKGCAAATLEVKEVPDPNASVSFRDQTPTVRIFADADKARKKALALYFAPFILSLALTEAIAIFGLVLGMQGADWATVLPFFVAAWILYLPRFPRWKAVTGPLEKAKKARLVDDVSELADTRLV